jgi:pyruvate dehydrogenase E2 component (dihydrolipoamide acetyltransferase)
VQDVFIPVLGMAPEDVTLISWLRSPGDPVLPGDAIALIETSKAQLELESESAGTLGPQLYPAGAIVAPGTTISHVLAPGEEAPAVGEEAGPTGVRQAVQAEVSSPPPPQLPASAGTATAVRAPHTTSPRARRMAAEAAVAGGTATAQAAGPAAAPRSIAQGAVPDGPDGGRHDSARAAIARAVSRSWTEVPHFAVSRELHVGDLVASAAQWRVVLPRLTVTDLLLRVLALAMVDTVGDSGVDIGLAVATDAGVVIPVLRRVPELGLADLVSARIAAVGRARERRMHVDDATVPTTTLSNLGALGVDQFTGVIPYGSTSLVTVGRAAERPVVIDGALTVATTMWATVNLDHRVYDGAHGARLLDRLAVIASAAGLFLGGGAPLAPASVPIPSAARGAER